MSGRDSDDLHEDLLYMRKGTGFTPERIVNAGTLRRVLGGEQEAFENLRERFVSAIHSLRHPAPEVLLAAYGLSDDVRGLGTLAQRRARYGELVGRGVDTIATREAAFLESLRVQLLTGWYPSSPLGAQVPEMHNGIVQETVHVVTVVRDRRWQETREHYRFLALFEEADFIAISSSYPGRPIPGPGWRVASTRAQQSHTHRFWPPVPMQRGHTYDLTFTLVPDPQYGEPGLVTEESRAFHERTMRASFEAIFLGEKPDIIWQCERLSYFERPGDPSTGHSLALKNTSSVHATFYDLYGGLFNGIAWRWAARPLPGGEQSVATGDAE